MINFTSYKHPVLAVPCKDCQVRAGVMCKRPSGHRASDFHKVRKTLADTTFISQHGESASIIRKQDQWMIVP